MRAAELLDTALQQILRNQELPVGELLERIKFAIWAVFSGEA